MIQPAKCPKCKGQDWIPKGLSGWWTCLRCRKHINPDRWIELMRKAAHEMGMTWV